MSLGKVFLVGAGPGDPKLLTIRAMEVFKIADVILHDRLVSAEILDLVPTMVKKLDVGKAPHCNGITQEEINQMMVGEARSGKNVVRLKGGDPLFFSRGFEELGILKAEGIEFEIVPGISSAIGVASYAGIPLTHRRHSSSVAIVTGHEDQSKTKGNVDWKRLASSVDTIVVLMGIGKISKIATELVYGGLPPSTPLAIIESGTTPDERIHFSTLDDSAKGRLAGRVKSPAVLVIGEVVNVGKKLCAPFIRGDAATLIGQSTSSMVKQDEIPVSWCMAAEFS